MIAACLKSCMFFPWQSLLFSSALFLLPLESRISVAQPTNSANRLRPPKTTKRRVVRLPTEEQGNHFRAGLALDLDPSCSQVKPTHFLEIKKSDLNKKKKTSWKSKFFGKGILSIQFIKFSTNLVRFSQKSSQ